MNDKEIICAIKAARDAIEDLALRICADQEGGMEDSRAVSRARRAHDNLSIALEALEERLNGRTSRIAPEQLRWLQDASYAAHLHAFGFLAGVISCGTDDDGEVWEWRIHDGDTTVKIGTTRSFSGAKARAIEVLLDTLPSAHQRAGLTAALARGED